MALICKFCENCVFVLFYCQWNNHRKKDGKDYSIEKKDQ